MNIVKIIFDKYNRASYLVSGVSGGITSKKPFATYCRNSPAGVLNLGNVTDSWRDPERRNNLFRTVNGKDVVDISVPSTYKDHFIPGIKPIMKAGSVKGLQYFMNINIDINFLDKETDIKCDRDVSDDALASKNVIDEEVSWHGSKRIIDSYKNQFYIDWLIAYYYAIANNVTPFERIRENDKCTVLVMMRSLDSWTHDSTGKSIYGAKYYIVRIGDSSRIAILSSSLVQRLGIELIYRDSCSEVLIPWSLINMSTERDSDGSYIIKYAIDTYKLMLLTYGTNPLQYLYGVYNRFYSTLVTKDDTFDNSEKSCWYPDFKFRYYYVGNNKNISAFISGLGSVVNKFKKMLKPITKAKDTEAEKPVTKKIADTPTEITDWPITKVNDNVKKEEADAYSEAFKVKNTRLVREQVVLKTVDIKDICLPTSQLEVLHKYKILYGQSVRIIGYSVVDHTNNKTYILAYNSAVKLINAGIVAASFGSYEKDRERPQIMTTTTDIVIKPNDETKTTFLAVSGDIEKMASTMSNANKDNDVNMGEANMNNTYDIGAILDEVVGYSKSATVRAVAEEAIRKYGNLKAKGIRITLTDKIMNSSNGPAGYAISAYGHKILITQKAAVEMACLGIVDGAEVKGVGNAAYIEPDKEIPVAHVKDIKGVKDGTTRTYERIAKTGEKLVEMLIALKNGSYTGRPAQSVQSAKPAQSVQSQPVQQQTGESAADINNRLIVDLNNANNIYKMALNERKNIEDSIAMAKLKVAQLEDKLKEHDAKIAEYKKKLAEAHERLAKSFKY